MAMITGEVSSTCIRSLTAQEWDHFAPAFNDFNYRQTSTYGEMMARRRRARCELVAVEADDRCLGIASVRVKRIPVLGSGLAYVDWGPLVRTASNTAPLDSYRDCLDALRRHYVDERGLTLRVRPTLGDSEWQAAVANSHKAQGFSVSDERLRYRTILLDLTPDLAKLRRGLFQRWRRCLNAAERAETEVSEAQCESDWEAFVELFDVFRERKGFSADLGPTFFADAQRRLPPSQRFMLLLARQNGSVTAGFLGSMVGEVAVYLLGATSESAMNTKAAYLLHWRAIESARERGCRWYDLGGIDPVENPGVYRFKKGISGIDLVPPGPFEASRLGVRSRFFHSGEVVYRSMNKNTTVARVCSMLARKSRSWDNV